MSRPYEHAKADGFSSEQFEEACLQLERKFSTCGRKEIIGFAALYLLQRDRAEIDGLTQMLNRDRFNREYAKIEKVVMTGGRESDADAILIFFVDIEGLHEANKEGHDKGDELVEGVKEVYDVVKDPEANLGDEEAVLLFQKVVRGDDLACRYGGDEFVFAVPYKQGSVDSATLQEKLNSRVDKALEEFNGLRESGQPKLRLHRGFASVTRDDPKGLGQALREADPKGPSSRRRREIWDEAIDIFDY